MAPKLTDSPLNSPYFIEKNLNDNSQEFSQESADALPERGQWKGKLDFVFGCISYAVGLGNVWRFPYLCYANGGGAFLIPYLICVVFCGIPLFVLEVSIGQYLSTGGIGVWNLVPIFKGVGFASMTMIGLCNIYYIVIIAWTLFYFVASFNNPLPWQHCGQEWNTAKCTEDTDDQFSFCNKNCTSPVQEYWERNVLDITNGLDELGTLRWKLLLCLFVAWIVVYGVIWRGLHQSGKLIWFTALFPYVILLILFFRAVILDGAGDGLLFYVKPDWSKLGDSTVWVSAGTQVLFGYGIGIGANIALGSYNRFHHNSYRDSIIACCVSSGTSLFSGLVIFSVIGHMAHVQKKLVSQVAQSGPGLAFLAYPEVVTKLPFSPFWAVLFFLMLIVLGVDSQFCTVEAFVTGIVDEYAQHLRPRRKLFTICVVIIQFILGIPLIMGNGMYVFQLMDFFSASGFSLMTVVFTEIVALSWLFGAKRLYLNMYDMLGFKPSVYFYYCWKYISPLIIAGIFIFSMVKYESLVYADTYYYPWWGELIGWCMALASILCIPSYMIYYLMYKSAGTLKQRWYTGITSIVPPRKNNDTTFIEDDSSCNEIMSVSIFPSSVLTNGQKK